MRTEGVEQHYSNLFLTEKNPRKAVERAALQLEALGKLYGVIPKGTQVDLCCICRNLLVTQDYEGGTDADCLAMAPRWMDETTPSCAAGASVV